MMLVNQIIAQIKIQEVWKALNEEKYTVSIFFVRKLFQGIVHTSKEYFFFVNYANN